MTNFSIFPPNSHVYVELCGEGRMVFWKAALSHRPVWQWAFSCLCAYTSCARTSTEEKIRAIRGLHEVRRSQKSRALSPGPCSTLQMPLALDRTELYVNTNTAGMDQASSQSWQISLSVISFPNHLCFNGVLAILHPKNWVLSSLLTLTSQQTRFSFLNTEKETLKNVFIQHHRNIFQLISLLSLVSLLMFSLLLLNLQTLCLWNTVWPELRLPVKLSLHQET